MPPLNVAAVCSKVMALLFRDFLFFEISWYYIFMPPLNVAAVCSKVMALLLREFLFFEISAMCVLFPLCLALDLVQLFSFLLSPGCHDCGSRFLSIFRSYHLFVGNFFCLFLH